MNLKKRARTDYIVVHCSATSEKQDIGAEVIRRWHREKGWLDIGYHYVIRRNGVIEKGRPQDTVGSHVAGHNSNSIGICMVGGVDANDVRKAKNNFTEDQFTSLLGLLSILKETYPNATIQGHRDFPNVAKACPSFDVKAWLKDKPL